MAVIRTSSVALRTMAVAALVLACQVGSAQAKDRVMIPVGDGANAVAAGAGGVWTVADTGVARIDPVTNRVVARVDPGVYVGSERTCDIAVGAGAVWAIGVGRGGKSALVRVDPATNRGRIVARLWGATCVAAQGDGLWVTSPFRRRPFVVRYDPGSGRVRARVRTGGFCDGVAVGHGSIWVACSTGVSGASNRVHRNDGAILRVDPRRNRIVEELRHARSTGGVWTGPAGVFAAVARGSVSRLLRLVPHGPRLLPAGASVAAVGGDVVWVVSGGVRTIDPETGEKVAGPFNAGPSPFAVALGFGSAWVANYGRDGSIVRLG